MSLERRRRNGAGLRFLRTTFDPGSVEPTEDMVADPTSRASDA
jgi:hypothetical protein